METKMRIHTTNDGTSTQMRIEGAIDEDVVFPSLVVAPDKTLRLDLSAVSHLNSCGIREWIKWLRGSGAESRVVFVRCPKIIVDQMNMVDGFLPKGAKVESFVVPYFCEKCEVDEPMTFEAGKNFDQSTKTVHANASPKCPKCGMEMEMDVIREKYFRFLKN